MAIDETPTPPAPLGDSEDDSLYQFSTGESCCNSCGCNPCSCAGSASSGTNCPPDSVVIAPRSSVVIQTPDGVEEIPAPGDPGSGTTPVDPCIPGHAMRVTSSQFPAPALG